MGSTSALSCETLAITSDLTPIHDIIIENETGFYLKNNIPQEIGKKVIEVLLKKEKYLSISKSGRQHVVSNFDWSIVTNNYEKLLSGLLL